MIAVASYNTRTTWNSVSGPGYDTSAGTVSDISNFSSRGPRRDCSNPAKCPPIMKPEIAAPGMKIMAALTSTRRSRRAVDHRSGGVHYASNGTSMATPHIAGAVALMLQQDPTMTPEIVKQRLYSSVQTNPFSTNLPDFNAATPDMPANPNYTWGYGILDAAAAVKASQPSTGTPVTVVEFYNQSLDHYFITYVAAEITKLDNGTFVGWVRTDSRSRPTARRRAARRPCAGSTFRRARATATSSGATRASATAR